MPGTIDNAAPLISTLIPTYRRPALLRRAILSALAQEGPPLQVCVYDNASGDDTAAVVAELAARDQRVRYHRHERNVGGFQNFQHAIARVDTPLFSILADDDLLLPGFYARATADLAAAPEAALWAGLTVRATPDGTVYDAKNELWPREGLYRPPEGLLRMARGLSPNWTGVVFRREVVENVGLLDQDVGAPSDLDYLLRIAARCPFLLSKAPVAVYLLNPQAFSEQGPFSAFWPGWLHMIEKLATDEALDVATRRSIEQQLNADARRMLLRRGANALARRNYAFAGAAAGVLLKHYSRPLPSALLGLLTALCSRAAPAQRCYTALYDAAVKRILARGDRLELQRRYGHLAARLAE